MIHRFRVLAVVLSPLLTATAKADDGVLEINQTCAVVGCFEGDTAGLPVTITDATPAKSFRLTSDLTVQTAGQSAISVRTSFARVDLAGFSLRGPVTCSGVPLVCTETGIGDGVAVDLSSREGIDVRNGVVTGFGDDGVSLGIRGVVEGVNAFQNGGDGIIASTGSAVRECAASLNGVSGIAVGMSGTIERSIAVQNAITGLDGRGEGVVITGGVARFNGSAGISATTASAILDNSSIDNQLLGIAAGLGSTIRGNTVSTNLADGILCGDRCTVSDNTVTGNGTVTTADGIECGIGCGVRANSVGLNRGFGLSLGTDSTYRENTITGNGTGTVSGGVNRGDNHCAGIGVVSAACP